LRQVKDVEVAFVRLNLTGNFSPILPPFASRGISRRLTWSASGDERGTKMVFSTISLGGIPPAPQKEEEEEEAVQIFGNGKLKERDCMLNADLRKLKQWNKLKFSICTSILVIREISHLRDLDME
jgi:hypothetical protein